MKFLTLAQINPPVFNTFVESIFLEVLELKNKLLLNSIFLAITNNYPLQIELN